MHRYSETTRLPGRHCVGGAAWLTPNGTPHRVSHKHLRIVRQQSAAIIGFPVTVGTYQGKVRGGPSTHLPGMPSYRLREGGSRESTVPCNTILPIYELEGQGKAGWICFLSVFYFWYDMIRLFCGLGLGLVGAMVCETAVGVRFRAVGATCG